MNRYSSSEFNLIYSFCEFGNSHSNLVSENWVFLILILI